MKKTIYNFMCVLVSFFAFLSMIEAATIEIENGEAFASETKKTVDLTISGDDLADYTKIEFEVSISTENADIDSITPKLISAGTEFANNNSVYSITNAEGLEKNMVVTITYNTYEGFDNSFTLTPVNVKLYNGEEEPVVLDAKSIRVGTIKYLAPASNDAFLKSLNVSKGNLTPEFDKDVFEYTIDVDEDVTSLTIGAIPSFSKATVEGDGRKSLEFDKNEFEIKVTAEDKTTTNTYKIIIYRGETSEPSAYLSNLSIKTKKCELSPKFDKQNNKYTVDAPFGTTKLDIDYVSEDRNATVEISGNENFEVGENKIVIKVLSSNKKDKQEYEITVNVDKESSNKPAPPLDPTPEDVQKPGLLVIVGIILVILLIIVLVAFLLFRKKKKKRKRKLREQESIQEETKSVTLYEEEKTTTYDINSFKEVESPEEIEKTKEFHFDFNDKNWYLQLYDILIYKYSVKPAKTYLFVKYVFFKK